VMAFCQSTSSMWCSSVLLFAPDILHLYLRK
jgi:hypothetical protein